MLTDEQKEQIETRFKQLQKQEHFTHPLTGMQNPLKVCAFFFTEIDGAVKDEQDRIKKILSDKYHSGLMGDEYTKDPKDDQLIELIIADIDAPPEIKIESTQSDDECPF